MTSRRNTLVYGMLLALWAGLIVWQIVEHQRVKKAERDALTEDARYVAMTCSRTMRVNAFRFGGIIERETVESTIKQLVAPSEFRALQTRPRGPGGIRPPELPSREAVELRAVVLVNSAREIAASAATTNVVIPSADELGRGPDWDAPVVWITSLVDFGDQPRRRHDRRAAA